MRVFVEICCAVGLTRIGCRKLSDVGERVMRLRRMRVVRRSEVTFELAGKVE